MHTKTPGHLPARPDLDERTRRVLSAVVLDHIEGGEPVGSLAVQRRADLDISAATVRAVMADLETLGYLEKPHTSAGRIPTGLGYRYYVDTLLRVQAPSAEERQLIEKSTLEAVQDTGGILAGTTRLLRELTHHAAAVASPRAQSQSLQRFARIELVPLREGRVLAVLVTRSGSVQNRLIAPIPGERTLTNSQLEESANFLNALLGDLTLDEARGRLAQELDQDRALLAETRSRALALGAQAIALGPAGPDLLVEGQASFLEEPAWAQDVAKVRELFRALEEKERVISVLDRAAQARELRIFIGAESGLAPRDLAVIAAPYRAAEGVLGTVGVIGPLRMDYARVIPLVELTARSLGAAIGEG
jgi:heat-inducible transcriptional repressor